MKFKYETWRKIYVREEGSFGRLPWFARAAGMMLLKICDDAGRIDVGEGGDLVEAVAFRMGATAGDRRMMRKLFPLLVEDGFLTRDGRYYVVKNFVAAQGSRMAVDPEPRTRTGREPDAKSDSSPLNETSFSVVPNKSISSPTVSQSIKPSDTQPADKQKAESASAQAREVFDHWRQVHSRPRAVLDGKRERVVREAIARHGLEDCLRAIDGCAQSDFHMGRDAKTGGRLYNDLELILRDAKHVEQFIAVLTAPKQPAMRNGKPYAAPLPVFDWNNPEAVARAEAEAEAMTARLLAGQS